MSRENPTDICNSNSIEQNKWQNEKSNQTLGSSSLLSLAGVAIWQEILHLPPISDHLVRILLCTVTGSKILLQRKEVDGTHTKSLQKFLPWRLNLDGSIWFVWIQCMDSHEPWTWIQCMDQLHLLQWMDLLINLSNIKIVGSVKNMSNRQWRLYCSSPQSVFCQSVKD